MGDDYGDYQNPVGGYRDQTRPGTVVADNSGGKAPPATGPVTNSGGGSKASTGPSFIQVTVNPASRVKAGDFVSLLNKSAGTVPEFKGKIKLNNKTKAIEVPDFSAQKVVPGQEWRFDLGKAGNDWEIATATLVANLDGPTYFLLQGHLQKGEERGFPAGDPDDGLIAPTRDLTDIQRGLILGVTVPSQALQNKNPPPPNGLPAMIAQLNSGRGLILIAENIVVQKGQKITTDKFPVPKNMMAMSFFHELSAHASFFQLGQDAAHSDPQDPANNAVDRNAAQAEASFRKAIAKDLDGVQKKLQQFITAMQRTP